VTHYMTDPSSHQWSLLQQNLFMSSQGAWKPELTDCQLQRDSDYEEFTLMMPIALITKLLKTAQQVM